MARFVVPVLVLVALVGGYVVGQQPVDVPGTPRTQWIGTVDPAARRWLVGKLGTSSQGQVGHYAPVGNDRMLDTTNGTFYVLNEDRWQRVATLVQSDSTTEGTIAASSEDPVLEAIGTKMNERLQEVARVEAAIQNATTDASRTNLERARDQLLDRIEELEKMKARLRPDSER